ncbi:MAG: hypothetical protein WCO63_02335 [Bacteroidota bacterium]
MTTVIIDTRKKEGKAMVEFLRKTNYAEVITDKPNANTREAMKDAENGKTVKCRNAADVFKKLGI